MVRAQEFRELFALSDDWHWGYHIFVSLRHGLANEDWSAVAAKLERYIHCEIKNGELATSTLWQDVRDRLNLEFDRADWWQFAGIDGLRKYRIRSILKADRYRNELAGFSHRVCLLIDDEVFESILKAPEPRSDESATERSRNRPGFIKAIDLLYDPHNPEDDNEMRPDYPGWMAVNLNYLQDFYSQLVVEADDYESSMARMYPFWDSNTNHRPPYSGDAFPESIGTGGFGPGSWPGTQRGRPKTQQSNVTESQPDQRAGTQRGRERPSVPGDGSVGTPRGIPTGTSRGMNVGTQRGVPGGTQRGIPKSTIQTSTPESTTVQKEDHEQPPEKRLPIDREDGSTETNQHLNAITTMRPASTMSRLLSLPNEILLLIAHMLESENNILSFALVNRQLSSVMIPFLYRYNIGYSRSSVLIRATIKGQPESSSHGGGCELLHYRNPNTRDSKEAR
jgi:hypothetical protein